MPELPEVQSLAHFLGERLAGSTVERAEVAAFYPLKTYEPQVGELVGRRIAGFERRGKHLCADASGLWLVLHLARGGWVRWYETVPVANARLGKGPLALRVACSGGSGFDVTEQGGEKRLAIWVVRDLASVASIARLGPDPLDKDFGPEALAGVLRGRTGTLKTVLADQSALAGVGNAYSDEALHAARLSPFKPAGRLSDDEVQRLHAALAGVLQRATQRLAGLPASGLKAEKRSGMAVHGRPGLPCPVCGDTIRQVSYAAKSLQYCPTCQTGGKELADRRLSRLLK